MFLLRYRRPHRYGSHLDRLPPPPPPVRPPGWDVEEPDPDAAFGTLDWCLDELVDEAELPGGISEASRANHGVNFVNFVGNDADDTGGENRHSGVTPGSTFSSTGAEGRRTPDQVRHDDDCDDSGAPVEPRP